MVNRENEIYTAIAVPLRAEFSGINVTGEYVPAPAKLPHVSIVEMDNYTPERLISSAATEKYAAVAYEVNVYSNLATGKKTQARSIMNLVDEKLISMGFRRASVTVVPNEQSASIYRIVARYTGIVTQSENTVYNK